MYGNDTTYISFSTKATVANIKEINWSIHTIYLFRDEPLKSSVTLLNRCGAIIILWLRYGCGSFKLRSLTIPEEGVQITESYQ